MTTSQTSQLQFLPFSESFCMSTRHHVPKININLIKEECNLRHKRQQFRHHSSDQMFIDMSNLWKTSSKDEQKLFAAVKKSDLFSEDRMDTFVKFNYRTMENKDMNYHTVFQKILKQKNKLKPDHISLRGSMNVSQLWSQKNLQEIIGSLPYPKDRLKILHSYEQNKALRVRKLRSKQIERERLLN